jgi:methylglyoxal synthase
VAEYPINLQDCTLALIAHDGKKADMVAFAIHHRATLAQCRIIATGTTGQLLVDKVGLKVERMLSGPIGGDAQVAARVVQGEIRAVFFFVDPLGKHPHDPDIQMLLRVCNVHNVPLATNPATAACIIEALEK